MYSVLVRVFASLPPGGSERDKLVRAGCPSYQRHTTPSRPTAAAGPAKYLDRLNGRDNRVRGATIVQTTTPTPQAAAILKTLKISPPSRILAVDRPAQTRRRT